MNELQASLQSQALASKKMSLETNANALQQLILQRYQALISISSIAFAVSGVIIAIKPDLIKCQTLAIISACLLALVALVALGRHLFLLRKDIRGISERIVKIAEVDWTKPFPKKDFKADYWPETLYGLLVLGVLLFGASFI